MATNQWIDPPERPDEETIERLRAACDEVPRISELWVTGSRFTHEDGTSNESTGIAVVLDPPIDRDVEKDANVRAEVITKLDPVWPTVGQRSWLWVSHALMAAHAEHCLPIYAKG